MATWFYRAMGVTVGKDTWLPADIAIYNFDALVIGSCVTIGGSCVIAPSLPPAGMAVSTFCLWCLQQGLDNLFSKRQSRHEVQQVTSLASVEVAGEPHDS